MDHLLNYFYWCNHKFDENTTLETETFNFDESVARSKVKRQNTVNTMLLKGNMKQKEYGLCPYNIRVGPIEKTTLTTLFNEDGSINKILQVAREIGPEYLNTDVLETVSKSNGDKKILTGKNIHYATKYATKMQKQTYCDAPF